MTDQNNQQAVMQVDDGESISVTLKIPGRNGEAQPWVVTRAKNAAAAEDQMRQLQHGGLFAQIGRAQAHLESGYRHGRSEIGSNLGQTPAVVGQEAAHAEQVASAAYNVGNGLGATAMSPQPGGEDMRGAVNAQAAAEQAPPAQQRPEPAQMAPPAPQPQPMVVQPPAPASAGQQQLQQYQQAPPAQPQVGIAPQAAAQPAPQQQGMFGQAPEVPGAPIILGQPARFHSGSNARGPWSAFFDPRPREQTEGLEDTNDPNHPGLAGGTHKFTLFLR